MSPELRKEYREQRFPPSLTRILMDDADNRPSLEEHGGRLEVLPSESCRRSQGKSAFALFLAAANDVP